MYLLSSLFRVSQPDDASYHQAAEQSPLHILPAPVLILLALACLLLAACVAGLTLGLMSLDTTGLDIVMRSNNQVEAEAARKIKPVRAQGNLLLVTLLFSNTIATELLPLVLEALVPGGYFSLIVSVVSIMLFGEIIPQAVCSRHPLLIGSFMIGFVKVLRAILYPLAAPIAYILDSFLGEELGTIYNREELKGLIDVHRNKAVLTYDETTILQGALEFSQKCVEQIMTPAANVFRLDIDSVLDRDTLLNVLRSGHSRIPLFEHTPNNIVCLLLVKQLILVNPDDHIPIRSLISKKKRNHKVRVAPALECAASTLISDLLNEFQKGRSHMAIVYDDITKLSQERSFMGIVTIEDIIEEILQEEIIDETDTYTDNTNTRKVLVRNADGRLVRTAAHNAQVVLMPGAKAAVLVKEIDVPNLRAPLGEAENGEKIRPDWKKAKPKPKPPANDNNEYSNSLSDPLLGPPAFQDLEKGTESDPGGLPRTESSERLGNRTTSDSGHLLISPHQTSHSDIRYALLPGLSSASLFGEDDPILPEDMAHPKPDESNEATTEREKQLQVRPLPVDASDERTTLLPTRNRPPGSKPTPPTSHRVPPQYGAVGENFELADSAVGRDSSTNLDPKTGQD